MKNKLSTMIYLPLHDAKFPHSNIWRLHRPDDFRRLRDEKACLALTLCEHCLLLNQFTLLLFHSSIIPTTCLIWYFQCMKPFSHQRPFLGSLLPSRVPRILACWIPLRLQVSIKIISLPSLLIPGEVSDSAPCFFLSPIPGLDI